ncbi:MAG: uncharacterized membrane protein (UPF0127 family) [Flavobacteriales bacterium]|jgi:uncharacterized membrane protein (UPF0127 family)
MKRTFLIVVCIGSIWACKDDNSTAKKNVTPTEIAFTKEGTLSLIKDSGTLLKTIDIEIADDDYQRETGLMHRAALLDSQGMLFVFDEEDFRGFYMKNTLISLDIIYIDANGKMVSFAEQTKPMDETTLPSQVPAMYVLEITGGLSEDWGLEAGDRIEWQRD